MKMCEISASSDDMTFASKAIQRDVCTICVPVPLAFSWPFSGHLTECVFWCKIEGLQGFEDCHIEVCCDTIS